MIYLACIFFCINPIELPPQGEIRMVQDTHRLTRDDQDRLYRFYPKTLEKIQKTNPLGVQDIKNLTRAGVADDVILYEMTLSRSRFYLTPNQEEELKQAGVSERVIQAMKHTVEEPDPFQ